MAEVVLVHGLWNRGWSMAAMAKRLRAMQHRVSVFSYPTRSDSLDGHADALHSFLLDKQLIGSGASAVHLVGHSLGGLVILNMCFRFDNLPDGRIVLLGSPVKGAAVVKRMEKLPGQRFIFGKIKGGLLKGFQQTPQGHETGVLSGTRSLGVGKIIVQHDEPNDGSVTVNETLLDGLKDRIELDVAHTQMLISSAVVAQVDHFLMRGSFQKPRS